MANENDKGVELTYTTASDLYDLEGTYTVEEYVGTTATGKRVRLVASPTNGVIAQRDKYVNNLDMSLSEHEWKVELQFGNVKPPAEEESNASEL